MMIKSFQKEKRFLLNKKRLLFNVVVIIFVFFISDTFVIAADIKSNTKAEHEQFNKVSELKIREAESEIIPGKNITRHLSVNPDIAVTKRLSPNGLSITGLKKGSTLIHIWDDEGRRTLRIIVEEKKKKK